MKRIPKGSLIEYLKIAGVTLLIFALFIGAIYFAVHNEGWGTFWCATFFGMALVFIAERYGDKE
jgi:hypothetical protein